MVAKLEKQKNLEQIDANYEAIKRMQHKYRNMMDLLTRCLVTFHSLQKSKLYRNIVENVMCTQPENENARSTKQ